MMWDVIGRIKEIIGHRELLFRLAIKDFKITYRRPFLGILWAVLVPLFTIFIFKLIFSKIVRVDIKDYPFFIYLMTAIFPWSYFHGSVSAATTSIQDSRELIKKVYFPRELIPISKVIANLINFSFSVVVMLGFLLCFKIRLTPLLLLLPLVIILHSILITGVCLIVSSLYVRYRDIKYIVEVFLMGLFYLTPVFYPLILVANLSKGFFKIYMLNPLVGIVNLYRITLLDGFMATLPEGITGFEIVGMPLLCSIGVLFLGLGVFRKHQAQFTDYI